MVFLALILGGCSKPSDSCNHPTGTALYNQQTVSLINGGCNVTLTPVTVNKLSAQSATICGMSAGYLYNKVLYNTGIVDSKSPLGLLQYPDNYFIFPVGGPNASTQCWYKVTQGQVDAGADNPTF